MSQQKIDLVAILSPADGKMDFVLGLLEQLAQSVHDNEPMALRYQIHREVNSADSGGDIVMIEQYENMAAFEHHQKTEAFLHFSRNIKEPDVLAKPTVVKVVTPVAGFASRL